jgi:hypothetical protein
MLDRVRAMLHRRRNRDLAEEDVHRRQAELERRKAEARMAEQQQRIGSHPDNYLGGPG